MNKLRWILLSFVSGFVIAGSAQDSTDFNSIRIKKMDSILSQNSYVHAYAYSPDKRDTAIKYYPEMYYEFRIEELDKTTPISLYYDSLVQHYIDLWLNKRRADLEKVIGLSEIYFPLFEEALDRHQLPLELKYLAIVESGLNPLAVSSSGAVGLWQLLLNAGKMFDLEINSYIDERSDPYKSTEAACRYLVYLNDVFNDWQLVLAAYNGGPGEIRKAIHGTKGNLDYKMLQPVLPEQTRNYVPSFIAVMYLLNNYQSHGVQPKKPLLTYAGTDSLYISYKVSFEQISQEIDISPGLLAFLNPQYKLKVIPESSSPMQLVLPSSYVPAYLAYQHRIYAGRSRKNDYFTLLQDAASTEGRTMVVHVVEKGEFFHKIAMNYNCTMEQLKAWNNLESNFLYPGQELKVWINETIITGLEKTVVKELSDVPAEAEYLIYQVQPGDNLYRISNRYGNVGVNTLREMNELDENNVLKPGMKLKIPAN